METESTKIIRQLIKDEIIKKPILGTEKFFFDKSTSSIQTANRINQLIIEEQLDANMWVINISYYAMFFAATALLAHFGHRIKTEIGIHTLTYHALVHYFVLEDNKIEKHFMEEYKQAVDEAEELLQISRQKTEEFINDFSREMAKRKLYHSKLSFAFCCIYCLCVRYCCCFGSYLAYVCAYLISCFIKCIHWRIFSEYYAYFIVICG